MPDPNNPDTNRRADGTFAPGNNANPAGRPKGKTLKEFAREFYMLKTDDEKRAYIEKVEEKRPGFAWEMAEGKATQDITSGGEKINPIPILGGISTNDSDAENSLAPKAD